MSYFKQFARFKRKSLVVYATYDLTFLPEFSREVVEQFQTHGIDHKVAVLPCGHYSTGEMPYRFMDAYYLCSFLGKSFKSIHHSAVGS
jgi:hypothetical protein